MSKTKQCFFSIEFLWKFPFWKVPYSFYHSEAWGDQKYNFNELKINISPMWNEWNIVSENLDMIEHKLYEWPDEWYMLKWTSGF